MTETTDDQRSSGSQGASWASAVLTGAALVLVVATVLWFFASRMSGPIIFEDEHGPLEIARVLVGQQETARTKYYPGYAFVLTPGTAAASTAYGEYRAALVANVSLLAGSALVLYLALLRSYASTPWRVALPVGVAFLLPYPASAAGLVWSEAGLIAAVSVVAALVVWYQHRRSPLIALSATALAGLSFVIHPRLIALAPSVLLALALTSGSSRRRLSTAAGGAVTAATGLIVAVVLRGWVTDRIGSTVDYRAPDPGLDRGLTAVTEYAGVLTGRISTDLLATAFVPVVALAIPSVRRRLAHLAPLVALAVSLASLMLLYTAANVFWGEPMSRSDFVYYTRYQGPGVILLAALAGLALCQAGGRRERLRPTAVAALAGGLVAAWLAVRVLIDPAVFRLPDVMANVPELAILGHDLHPDRVFLLTGIVGAGVLALAALPLDRALTVAVAGTVAVAMSSTWYERYAHPGSEAVAGVTELVVHFEDLGPGDCVLYDRHSVPFWTRSNYEFFSSARFRNVDAPGTCGPLLVVGPDTPVAIPESATPIAREPLQDLTLYRLEGPQ